MWIAVIIAIVFAAFLLYVLALRGRGGEPGTNGLAGYDIAHRGLHEKPTVPENSMLAFARAVAGGYGIELDLHLLSDGTLAVFHDDTLKRTTGKEGKIKELTFEELKEYTLEGTDEHIPTFGEVLELVKGKVPLIIELKCEGNAAALCEATLKALEGYGGYYCIESFDPRPLIWLSKNRPEVTRGQLCQNFFKEPGGLPFVLRIVLTSLVLNFLTRPDFIAYKLEHRGDLPNHICTRLWGVQSVYWTIRDREALDTAKKAGAVSIFENFKP